MITVQALTNIVYLNVHGEEVQLPYDVIKEIILNTDIQKKLNVELVDKGMFMQVYTCPSCGVVPSYTGTCQYCGTKLED